MKGVETATAAVKHYLRHCALGHDKGCVVEAHPDGYGITLKIGGIEDQTGGREAASRIGKKYAIAWAWWASVARVVQFDNATFV